MYDQKLLEKAVNDFTGLFQTPPESIAYAPGRVEILGNHTDYNEGYVLSSAIDFGTFFLASRSKTSQCQIFAGDIREKSGFDATDPLPSKEHVWSNYVRGVFAGISKHTGKTAGFNGYLIGNLPLGAGLSSSAALEMSSALALSRIFDADIDKISTAKIGQKAEHEFAGVKCGLLDQITSLFGKEGHLVMTDFRTLDVLDIQIKDACFIILNSKIKHALVDGEYNERRHSCENAARFFTKRNGPSVKTLRDVTWQDFEKNRSKMDKTEASRAAHIIGENSRVLEAARQLKTGDLLKFGTLMYESHASSMNNFQNSCKELDVIVDSARNIPGILGARLSGGGFGGSVVALTHPRDAEVCAKALSTAYEKKCGIKSSAIVIKASDGARHITIQ